jgi:hypothetical protein
MAHKCHVRKIVKLYDVLALSHQHPKTFGLPCNKPLVITREDEDVDRLACRVYLTHSPFGLAR